MRAAATFLTGSLPSGSSGLPPVRVHKAPPGSYQNPVPPVQEVSTPQNIQLAASVSPPVMHAAPTEQPLQASVPQAHGNINDVKLFTM